MSWSTWHSTAPPLPGMVQTAQMQSTVLTNPVNPTPGLLPPPATAAIPAGIQYSPEQWAQMQQQNWQQWAQWQQQYQQWHQQYGAEYQKSMSALSASTAAPPAAIPPPPPNESKPPPPPPDDVSVNPVAQYSTVQTRAVSGYSTVAPAVQQYTSAPPPTPYSNQHHGDWQNASAKRAYPQAEEYESNKRQMMDNSQNQWNKPSQPAAKTGSSWQTQPPPSTQTQAQKVLNLEELTEAERKFDKEFAAWEAQFNKWKDQNANHPDKSQYLEYEKKWESWRNSLLDRREQMRKKRVALQASMATPMTAPPPKPAAAPLPPQQTFKQPPPTLPQAYPNQQESMPGVDLFNKPPPTQNNEPLTFKPASTCSEPVETAQIDTSNVGDDFLKSSSPAPGGIPGLDLVKEGEGEVEDHPDDEPPAPQQDQNPPKPTGPDLDAISKGINTILGDSKLLNMLSAVSQNQNFSTGIPIDTQPKMHNVPPPAPAQKPSAPIPSLLSMPLQKKPELAYNDYSEPYNSSNQLEQVNNFDDQTRMSFTNGPNDQEYNFPSNAVNPPRPDRFSGPDNRHMFSGNANGVRSNSFEGPMNNTFDGQRNTGFDGPRNTDFDGPRNSGFDGPRNTGFDGPRNTGFDGPRNAGFDGPRNTGFDGPSNAGVDGPRSAGFDGPRNTGFDGQRNAGFDGPRNTGFDGQRNAGFDGPRNTGFDGQRNAGFDGPRNTGFDGQRNAGFDGPRNSGFDGPRSAGFDGPRSAGFDGPRNAGFDGPRNTGFDGPRNTGFDGQRNVGFDGPRNAGFDGPRNAGLDGPRNAGFDGPRNAGLDGPRNAGLDGPRNAGFDGPRNAGFDGPRNAGFDGPRNAGFDGPRKRDFDGPPPLMSRNVNGPRFNQYRDAPADKNYGSKYNDRFDDRNQYGDEEGDEQQWNEEDEFDKYHDMFNEGDPSLEGPPENEGRPFRNEGRSFAEEDRQFANEGRPFANRGRPFSNEGRPFANEGRPFPNEGRPFPNEGRQFVDEGPAPFPDEGRPFPNEGPPFPNEEPFPNKEPLPLVDDGPLFVPEVVVDYEHKPLKPPEVDISLDMIRMFDYRHKPVNRIPYPQRPVWLSSTLRNIKQFDPLGTGRFSTSDIPFEREPMRFPPERKEAFDRRPNFEDRGPVGNDRYSRDRYRDSRNERAFDKDFERERNAPKKYNNKDTNYRQPRNPYPEDRSNKPQPVDRKLDLEELSEDEWTDDKDYSEKQTLKFSPPAHTRNIDVGHQDLSFAANPTNPANNNTPLNQNTTLDELLNPPGRQNRPPRIVLILRGPPGSGKTYLAKLIKDKEVENGGSAPRILSLDDYFMVEHEKEVIEDGKTVRIKEMTYEYEAEMEESYRQSLVKAFKKTITDGYFHFVVVDNINQKVKNFGEMWSFAKQSGFQVYICQLDLDPELCKNQNIHHRSESYIEDCIAGWEPTPSHHPQADPLTFLQSAGSITEVEMEEAEQQEEEVVVVSPAKRSEPPRQWKNTSSWSSNQDRKGFGAMNWNRNNRR